MWRKDVAWARREEGVGFVGLEIGGPPRREPLFAWRELASGREALVRAMRRLQSQL